MNHPSWKRNVIFFLFSEFVLGHQQFTESERKMATAIGLSTGNGKVWHSWLILFLIWTFAQRKWCQWINLTFEPIFCDIMIRVENVSHNLKEMFISYPKANIYRQCSGKTNHLRIDQNSFFVKLFVFVQMRIYFHDMRLKFILSSIIWKHFKQLSPSL